MIPDYFKYSSSNPTESSMIIYLPMYQDFGNLVMLAWNFKDENNCSMD